MARLLRRKTSPSAITKKARRLLPPSRLLRHTHKSSSRVTEAVALRHAGCRRSARPSTVRPVRHSRLPPSTARAVGRRPHNSMQHPQRRDGDHWVEVACPAEPFANHISCRAREGRAAPFAIDERCRSLCSSGNYNIVFYPVHPRCRPSGIFGNPALVPAMYGSAEPDRATFS